MKHKRYTGRKRNAHIDRIIVDNLISTYDKNSKANDGKTTVIILQNGKTVMFKPFCYETDRVVDSYRYASEYENLVDNIYTIDFKTRTVMVLQNDKFMEAEVRKNIGSYQDLLVPKRGRKQTMRQVNAKSSLYSNQEEFCMLKIKYNFVINHDVLELNPDRAEILIMKDFMQVIL